MAESCVPSAESLLLCTECIRQLPRESIVMLSSAPCSHHFSVCKRCASTFEAAPPRQCPECKQSMQRFLSTEATSGEQLIATDDQYSSLPDLHPLPEVGYSQEKDVLVCHEQFQTRIHQQTLHEIDSESLDVLFHMVMDNQSELELQHDTTSLLQPDLWRFYSLQPTGSLTKSLI